MLCLEAAAYFSLKVVSFSVPAFQDLFFSHRWIRARTWWDRAGQIKLNTQYYLILCSPVYNSLFLHDIPLQCLHDRDQPFCILGPQGLLIWTQLLTQSHKTPMILSHFSCFLSWTLPSRCGQKFWKSALWLAQDLRLKLLWEKKGKGVICPILIMTSLWWCRGRFVYW